MVQTQIVRLSFRPLSLIFIRKQHFERKYNEVEDSDEDDEDTIHERPSLLRESSNHLFPHRKVLCPQDENGKDADLVRTAKSTHDDDFISLFPPTQMKYLALVSHNGMKSTMKRFVLANKNILKKFCLTGTNSTMTMLKEVIGKKDPDVVYGPSCSSGPLGGDAELAALMTQGKVGGIIFFTDPMSAHPHQADIDGLCRLAMVHNTMILQNPTTAVMMMDVLRNALRERRPEIIPSFFFDLVSPSVSAYKEAQRLTILEKIADDDVTVTSAAVRRRSLQLLDLDVTFKDFVDSDEEESLIDNSLKESRIQNYANGSYLSTNKPNNSMPPTDIFVGEISGVSSKEATLKKQRAKSRIKRRPKEVVRPPVRAVDVVVSSDTRLSTAVRSVGLLKSSSYVSRSTNETSSTRDTMSSNEHPTKTFSKMGRQKAGRRMKLSKSTHRDASASASAGFIKKRTTHRWR